MNTAADCCPNPQLTLVEVFSHDSDAKLTLQQCDNCQTYWRVFADRVATEQGDVIEWDWFERLTEEQAEAMVLDTTLSQ